MINSEPDGGSLQQEAAVSAALQFGAIGAVVLAGLSTAVVVAIWLAFYLLVFVPRVVGP
jgi:hypothetical protein